MDKSTVAAALKVVVVVGTRPEVIKMAPVLRRLRQDADRFLTKLVLTGQHRELLQQALQPFGLRGDANLDIMVPDQSPGETFCRAMEGMLRLYKEDRPDLVLVQGDTVSAAAAALAAFYERLVVGHVEAGLRTYDRFNPFPEEVSRRALTAAASLHFAPTARARQALVAEGIPLEDVFLTGNTVVDAVRYLAEAKLPVNPETRQALEQARGKRVVLAELHRRENLGRPLENVCRALRRLVERRQDAFVIFSVHPNPNVRDVVFSVLRDPSLAGKVVLLDPPDYPSFVTLMNECYLILTDSGGIQEEAPSLGKPVLVARNATERPEGVEAGMARLVGVEEERVLAELESLFLDNSRMRAMTAKGNPYGDGRAADKIVRAIEFAFGIGSERPDDFAFGGPS